MLGRRIAARPPHPICLPELRRALLDEWYNIPQDQIDNLILSMPRRFVQLTIVTNKNAVFIIGAFLMPALLAFTAMDPFFCWGSQYFSSQAGNVITPSFEVDATVLFGLDFIEAYRNLV
ncbi:uncharacterized protein TNCV_3397341 [Trichonephila clavipes]|nr:uncharacterized protein TNCV_3397341 [Trichonephila clavipes]